MLFRDVQGRPVPVLDDAITRADGDPGLMPLDEAAEHFRMSPGALREIFDAFFAHLVPQNAPLISPGVAAATAANPTRAALLRRYLYPDLSFEHIEQFLRHCDHLNLDPWCKQVYPRTVDAERGGPQLVVLLAIGGLRALAHRTGEFAGVDAPVFTYGEHERFPVKAEITVYRLVDGVRTPFTGSALWEEFYPGPNPPTLWDEKPTRCLETPAEAQALRRAFNLDGLHAPEEFHRGEFDRRRAGRPAGPSGGGAGAGKAGAERFGGDVEEIDAPTTNMQFHLRLIDLGAASETRRNTILEMLKARFARLYMEDEGRFYAHAFAYLLRRPGSFGLAAPEPAAGAAG